MTPDAERAYVQNWIETGRLLEDLRWRDLRALDNHAAWLASDRLLEAACKVPLPEHRRRWSGLVDLQDLLHARR